MDTCWAENLEPQVPVHIFSVFHCILPSPFFFFSSPSNPLPQRCVLTMDYFVTLKLEHGGNRENRSDPHIPLEYGFCMWNLLELWKPSCCFRNDRLEGTETEASSSSILPLLGDPPRQVIPNSQVKAEKSTTMSVDSLTCRKADQHLDNISTLSFSLTSFLIVPWSCRRKTHCLI